MTDAAHQAAERAARHSYGRLLASLASRTRDIAQAQDALSEAFARALASWPRDGVPDRPEAWLLTTARRAAANVRRHQGVAVAAAGTLALLHEVPDEVAAEQAGDERLRLLFVCTHPAIDRGIRAPLMLQIVFGLDAARIAAAFQVPASTLGQRLVRAKVKIRDSGIPFEVPPAGVWPERLGAVLEAVYGALAVSWDDSARGELAQDALDLARLVAALMPAEPEALGLASLALHVAARAPARRDAAGAYVPLDQQDRGLWSRPMIAEAERHLMRASRLGRPGRFQLEAAIQSAHASILVMQLPPWEAILRLYDRLIAMAPGLGARVARAAVVGEVRGAEAALRALDEVAAAGLGFQPWWAVRAHWLGMAGQVEAAGVAYGEAIRLARDPAVAAFLDGRRDLALGRAWGGSPSIIDGL